MPEFHAAQDHTRRRPDLPPQLVFRAVPHHDRPARRPDSGAAASPPA
ncbi:hypothetical protein [Micromonospora musae]